MIYGHSKAPADLMQSYTLHKQAGLTDAASGIAQTRQDYYLDRAPILEDADRSNSPRQMYEGAALVLKIYADSGVTTPASASDILGADIKIYHADADATGEAPGTFTEFDLSELADADCIVLNEDVNGSVLEMRHTVEDGTGIVATVLANLDLSRMKRFIQAEVTPQFGGSAVDSAELVLEAVVAGSKLYKAEKTQEIAI